MRPEEDAARDLRISMEAIVDAHDSEERAMGWYYYLDDKLKFPFKARCRLARSTSPIKIGAGHGAGGRLRNRNVRLGWTGQRSIKEFASIEDLNADLHDLSEKVISGAGR